MLIILGRCRNNWMWHPDLHGHRQPDHPNQLPGGGEEGGAGDRGRLRLQLHRGHPADDCRGDGLPHLQLCPRPVRSSNYRQPQY